MKTDTFNSSTFEEPKQAFFRAKSLNYNLLTFLRVYTHGLRLFLKKGFFVRKFVSFLMRKWLFCEGNLKMCILETWELVFETLGSQVVLGVRLL